MKKLTKMLISLLLVISIAIAPACGGEPEPDYDESKTTVIYLQNYDCGYGRTYISETAKKFMEKVKDVEYEPGKKGVYIDILNTQSNSYGDYLTNSIRNSKYDVFMTTNIDPLVMNEESGFMNLKDIVNATSATQGYRFAESNSILERIFPDARGVIEEDDGDVFYLPLFLHAFHIVYDEDLLKEKSLFIAEGSTDTTLNLTNDTSELNAGPDGAHGTYDDGLPQTYDQFYLWCDEIVNQGVAPINYCGTTSNGQTFALFQFWADYEGADDYRRNFTFTGTESDLVNEVDDNGNVLSYYPSTEITAQNGYMLTRQQGILETVRFAKKVSESEWLHQNCLGSLTNLEAQEAYLWGKYSNDRMAMHIDGNYWEAEAKTTFEECEANGGGKMDRNFKVLPIPKADRSKVGTDNAPARSTVSVDEGLQLVVRSTVEESKLQAIKDFIMYFHSDEALQIRHVESGVPVPFDYDLSSENQAKLSTYGKSLYNTYFGENVDVVFTYADNHMYWANRLELNRYNRGFNTLYGGDKVTHLAITHFMEQKRNGTPVSVKQYYNGIYENFTRVVAGESKWDKMYNKTQN